jgi:hypothetical protein
MHKRHKESVETLVLLCFFVAARFLSKAVTSLDCLAPDANDILVCSFAAYYKFVALTPK